LQQALDHRDAQRRAFLDREGFAGCAPQPLRQDASFRRYFRITRENTSWLLMDAPPDTEHLEPWLQIGAHLKSLGFRTPEVLAQDVSQGFALIEDFGTDTFTQLLDAGEPPDSLYTPAIDLLISLHSDARSQAIDVPIYDLQTLLREAGLLPEWFLPLRTGHPSSPTSCQLYEQAWIQILSQLPPPAHSLVLRDFHVDNLMRLAADHPLQQIGLLDFQDALIGPLAYDLLSLLEDARRDIPETLRLAMRQRYLDALPWLDQDNFSAWYSVLAAQRHCKVLGIFSRLALRDQKSQYLVHLDRVLGLLNMHRENPLLQPLHTWLEAHLDPVLALPLPYTDVTRVALGLAES
jgi:aminoglycoside/choline kinase family phosphotransferase